MKLKKIPVFICFILVLAGGYLCISIITSLLYNNNNNDCPQYIEEFVKNNPQAKELQINYQNEENDDPIILENSDEIPLFIQWDKRWAYTHYGDEIVGTAGCGPTSLSMVAIGLTGNTDYNPRFIAKYAIENGYLEGSKTTWALMEKGCQAFGLKAASVPLDKNSMINQLKQGNPIICSVKPGDFTTTGHFLVITKTIDDEFCINDPNSKENSQRTWTYERLSRQIKAMWAFSLL